jgi:hypothetical protein
VEFAALGAWILSAAVGAYLMVVWTAHGGLVHQATKVTRFPVLVMVGHPLGAMIGMAVWVGYLVTGHAAYAWAAFAALIIVIIKGVLLFTRWLVGQGGRHARGTEQDFPARAVVAHATTAIATFVLVFLTAIRIGGG